MAKELEEDRHESNLEFGVEKGKTELELEDCELKEERLHWKNGAHHG